MLKRTATTSYPPEIPLPLFGEVEIGGCFTIPGDRGLIREARLYMKIRSYDGRNSISLDNGDIYKMDPTTYIVVVNTPITLGVPQHI